MYIFLRTYTSLAFKWRQQAPLKSWQVHTKLHTVISKMTFRTKDCHMTVLKSRLKNLYNVIQYLNTTHINV